MSNGYRFERLVERLRDAGTALMSWIATEIETAASFLGDAVLVLVAAGALITFALSQLAATRDRQRQEYAKALQTVFKWLEMPYRIRRRNAADEEVQARLVERMHELQEELAFHDAWLSVEATEVAAAFKKLVDKVKMGTEPHLQHAWAVDHSPPLPMNIGACYAVDCESERALYVSAVQYHLRWWGLWRRVPILKRCGRPNARIP